ncbi:MAG: AbrB/MazE/SpoVT family DNA-binding domain-containing protein [Oscillospiraceae bacterium]|nr:AbrB/MazE/SpoVT family DNA-binding domain-containing protein [Oscillospiraceae bacterium]
METRSGKISVYSSGGTASAGSMSYRVSLPSSWIKELGLDKDNSAELVFDGKSIIIRPMLSDDINKFKSAAIKSEHNVVQYEYFDKATLCSTIICDFTDKTLRVVNHTDNLLKTAFGVQNKPDWNDFMEFMAERCVPKTRDNLTEILKKLNLNSYDAVAIVEKTQGRMAEDDQWLKITKL